MRVNRETGLIWPGSGAGPRAAGGTGNGRRTASVSMISRAKIAFDLHLISRAKPRDCGKMLSVRRYWHCDDRDNMQKNECKDR